MGWPEEQMDVQAICFHGSWWHGEFSSEHWLKTWVLLVVNQHFVCYLCYATFLTSNLSPNYIQAPCFMLLLCESNTALVLIRAENYVLTVWRQC